MNTQPATILAVDDNPTNLQVLFKSLHRAGFKVLVATTGEAAIRQAKLAQPDAILLDIIMPGLDGFETCRRLKDKIETKDIPVIFLSALRDTTNKVKGLKVGAVDYITKPFQQEEVLTRLQTHLTIRNLQKSLQAQNERLQAEINERKRVEELLRKLSRVVEQTTDIVVITNKTGVIEYVNPAFEQETGYTKVEVIGKMPSILKSGEHHQGFYTHMWQVALSGKVYQAVVINKDKNGRLYYEEKTITPLRDAQGKITHFVSTGKDITKRKKAEDEREKLIFDLQEALTQVKRLSGLLPICANCKKIRNDKGYWQDVAVYIRDHSEADFSHSVCPSCMKELYPDFYD